MESIILKDGWQFGQQGESATQTVCVPHTVALEELNVFANKQGIFEYSKQLFFEDVDKELNIFVHFDGVMINCEVYFNDELLCKHFGGYLPFEINITDKIKFGQGNTIKVVVDNRDDGDTPPGKPTGGLDFLYYGGIYRAVTLIKKGKIYITDPLDGEDGGGIKFWCEKSTSSDILVENKLNIASDNKDCGIKEKSYDANITAVISNTFETEQKANVIVEIKDKTNIVVKKEQIGVTLQVGAKQKVECHIENLFVKEWSLDEPNLYDLSVKIEKNGQIIEEAIEEIGFRHAVVKEDGFYLNDKKIELFGTNRHQQYPYIGIAASENAQRREARLLKESGINTLRLAHYPQSPAFLSECDRVGIVVIDCVPGWQYWGGKVWQARLQQNLIDMIRRDRNHCSCIIFEITPNETYCMSAKGDAYFRNFVAIARKELPTVVLSGDTLGRKCPSSIDYDIPHTGNKPNAFSKLFKKKRVKLPLQREYGDWNFGGNNSTTRVSRGDGEFKMQTQAWNFQWTYNNLNLQRKLIGSLTWEGIDHNRGYFPKEGLSKSGYFDIFRLKKYAYYFLKSQKTPICDDDIVLFPLINSIVGKTKIPVYSNCQVVKIFVGDKLVAEKTCDNGATLDYDSKKLGKIDEAYWLTATDHIATGEKVCNAAKHTIGCLFDGGNCEFMQYPPFTFFNLNLNNAQKITFKGYIDGKEVKSIDFAEPQNAVALDIQFADSGIKLLDDNNDFLFVYAIAKDKNGSVDCNFDKNVEITVEGGEAIFTNQINAEAGIASFEIKANVGASKLVVKAVAKDEKLSSEAIYKL